MLDRSKQYITSDIEDSGWFHSSTALLPGLPGGEPAAVFLHSLISAG
jgi:hypothetical protein